MKKMLYRALPATRGVRMDVLDRSAPLRGREDGRRLSEEARAPLGRPSRYSSEDGRGRPSSRAGAALAGTRGRTCARNSVAFCANGRVCKSLPWNWLNALLVKRHAS